MVGHPISTLAYRSVTVLIACDKYHVDVIGDKLGGSGGAHWAISIHARGIHPGWLWPVDGFAFNKERKNPLDPDQIFFFRKGSERHFQPCPISEKRCT